MQMRNSFTVDQAPDDVWRFLLDVERVVPCMPGAELTGTLGDDTWGGQVRVKIGPVVMKYAGTVKRVARDDANRSMSLVGQASEMNGKGAVSAQIDASVLPHSGGGAEVTVVTDLTLSGAAAQFGGRMIEDVSIRLTKQFAANLNQQVAAGPEAPPPTLQDVSGLRMALFAVFDVIARWVKGATSWLRRPARANKDARE